MNLQHLELVDGLALVGAVGCGLLALTAMRAQRLAQRSLAISKMLSARVASLEQQVELLNRQASDNNRRLDWLELCERRRENAGAVKHKAEDKTAPADPASMSITERRHRVLTLAKRGLEAEQIADTLGVPHGEVELIISLNTAA